MVHRMAGGQWTDAGEDRRQQAAVLGRHVQDDTEGRGEILGKLRHQLGEGFHPSHRGPDDDEIVVIARHAAPAGFEWHSKLGHAFILWHSSPAVTCQAPLQPFVHNSGLPVALPEEAFLVFQRLCVLNASLLS